MLIPFSEVYQVLENRNTKITGILHIGAHECEEREAYMNQGIPDSMVYWVEGNPEKVHFNKEKGVPHIYQGLIYNEEKEVDFYITDNFLNPGNTESSSILPLDKHKQYYPHVQITNVKKLKTVTLESLVREHKLPIQQLNFWNLDIQGVELEALKSAGDMIHFADAIYVEVNTQHLYKGCSLLPDVENFLSKYGFVRTDLKMTEQGWGDAFFVRI